MEQEKEKNAVINVLLPLLIVLGVYLMWTDWDYKTILPSDKQAKEISLGATPQVWSGHKVLNMSAVACAIKGEQILQSLQFQQIVKNSNYVYGNYQGNRAAVKCVTQGTQTFMYAIVAGADVKQVEHLRNQVVQNIK